MGLMSHLSQPTLPLRQEKRKADNREKDAVDYEKYLK